MNISEACIRRPVMTTLITASLIVFGIFGYRLLAVAALPRVDFPTIQVTATLPGASPETMAASVAGPIERQFSTIAGISSMTSTSSLGQTQITIQFDLKRNIDGAALDVQTALAVAQRRLPIEMTTPPSFRKVNPGDQPVLFISLISPTLPMSTVDEYGQTILGQQISQLPGVAQVLVFGSQKFAVRVQVDPVAAAARSISLDDIRTVLTKANSNTPVGTLSGADRTVTLLASGALRRAADYRPVVAAWRNGAPVRLSEIANVIDSVENDKTAAWFRDKRGLILAIQKQPGTNTVEVADSIRALLPTFRSQLPASVNLDIHRDRAESIRASVNDVKFTLALTLFLVVMVIFLFLRNISATVIPSLALPMSIVGTFAVMYLLDYSLDNLSLMALTLSVGFVVDDAIVMLENIVRHMEMGEPPLAAAFNGSKEIGFTIISMTISLAAVFIPILFMGGILGRLFHEFAVTIGAAILVSGFVSLSLTPLLSARFLKSHKGEHHGRVYQTFESFFDGMLHLYERGLRAVLDHRLATLVVSGVILAGTVWLYMVVPKGFLPSEDQDQIFISTEAAQGISYADMVRHQLVAANIVLHDPNTAGFFSRVGGNTGIISIRLKPRKERRMSADEIINALRPKLNAIPGLRCYLQNPPPIRLGGRGSQSLYQYTMQGPDTNELYAASQKMFEAMRKMPGLVDVASDLQIKNPQVVVTIDHDRAAALGLTTNQIEDALYSGFGTRQISTIYAPTNSYQVIMEIDPKYQQDPSSLSLLYVRAASGELVPVSSFAHLQPSVGPLTINHSGQSPSVTISFNLKPGMAVGDAITQVDKLARATLPARVTTAFQGTAQAFQSSFKGLGFLLLMAIAVIYMVLGILYESFIHPITILSALPFAGFGALLTLLIFHVDLSIYAFVGIIMLVGLVKKNGIMMVDFAVERQREGETAERAIYDACVVRFRPIMMTTMAALMGTLPIALGFGAGAESRRPLGLAVVGGLLFSQTLTLFVTPVFFLYMERLRTWRTPSGRSGDPIADEFAALRHEEAPLGAMLRRADVLPEPTV